MRNLISLPLFVENDFDKQHTRACEGAHTHTQIARRIFFDVVQCFPRRCRVRSSDVVDQVWWRLLETIVQRAAPEQKKTRGSLSCLANRST